MKSSIRTLKDINVIEIHFLCKNNILLQGLWKQKIFASHHCQQVESSNQSWNDLSSHSAVWPWSTSLNKSRISFSLKKRVLSFSPEEQSFQQSTSYLYLDAFQLYSADGYHPLATPAPLLSVTPNLRPVWAAIFHCRDFCVLAFLHYKVGGTVLWVHSSLHLWFEEGRPAINVLPTTAKGGSFT